DPSAGRFSRAAWPTEADQRVFDKHRGGVQNAVAAMNEQMRHGHAKPARDFRGCCARPEPEHFLRMQIEAQDGRFVPEHLPPLCSALELQARLWASGKLRVETIHCPANIAAGIDRRKTKFRGQPPFDFSDRISVQQSCTDESTGRVQLEEIPRL